MTDGLIKAVDEVVAGGPIAITAILSRLRAAGWCNLPAPRHFRIALYKAGYELHAERLPGDCTRFGHTTRFSARKAVR